MLIEALVVGMIQANCFIISNEQTKDAVIVDPGGNASQIVSIVEKKGLHVKGILVTHGHFDHVDGLKEVKTKIGAPIYAHAEDEPLLKAIRSQGVMFGMNVNEAPPVDVRVTDGQVLDFGGVKAKVLHTPGHSPGSVCYLIGDSVFVGDLIFLGSIGRTDLMGGDYATLIRSVEQKIFTLPDTTTIYPGHGPKTTVAGEKRSNPFFN